MIVERFNLSRLNLNNRIEALSTLEPGDSLFFDQLNEAHSMRVLSYYFLRTRNLAWRFTFRKIDKGWRLIRTQWNCWHLSCVIWKTNQFPNPSPTASASYSVNSPLSRRFLFLPTIVPTSVDDRLMDHRYRQFVDEQAGTVTIYKNNWLTTILLFVPTKVAHKNTIS